MGDFRRALEGEARIELVPCRQIERDLIEHFGLRCRSMGLRYYGRYRPLRNKIVMMRGMHPRTGMGTLCHELAHYEDRRRLILVELGSFRLAAALLAAAALALLAGLAAWGLGACAAGLAVFCWALAVSTWRRIDDAGEVISVLGKKFVVRVGRVVDAQEKRASRREKEIYREIRGDRRLSALARRALGEARSRGRRG